MVKDTKIFSAGIPELQGLSIEDSATENPF